MGFGITDAAMAAAKDLLPDQKGKDTGDVDDFLSTPKQAGGGVASKLSGLLGGGGSAAGGGDSGGGGGIGGALGGLFGGFPPGGDGGSGLQGAADQLGKKTTATGKPTKIHESKDAAKADLLTGDAKPPPQGTVMDESSSDGEATCFGTTHIRKWVRNEFKRREQNFGMRYTSKGEFADNAYEVRETSAGSGEFTEEYNDSLYRGPKNAWMRVISNAIGPKPEPDDGKIYGFEMHGWHGNRDSKVEGEGPVGFHEQYGIDKTSGQGEADTYMGRGWDGEGPNAPLIRHMIKETDFKHRPSPGITSIKSEDKEPGKNYRETTINFVVHSRNQLDYMDDYFFKIGVTCIAEWGWNTYPRDAVIDPTNMGKNIERVTGEEVRADSGGSLLKKINAIRSQEEGKSTPLTMDDIEDPVFYRTSGGTGLVGLFSDPVLASNHLRKGRGNYSYTIGMISNYSYTLRDDGGYDCEVKVTSMSKICAGLDNQATTEKDGENKPNPDERQRDFKLFVAEKLDEILEGDEDPNEWYDGFDQGIDDISEAIAGPKFSKGRYFTFDQSNGEDECYHSDHEDSYITLGFLIDIVNKFFKKTSKETNIGVYEFNIGNSRCCAHPNIKSCDGKVLLIPNQLSPRRNAKSSERVEDDTDDTNARIQKFFNGRLSTQASEAAFVAVVNAKGGKKNPTTDLMSALEKSPRDDLHRILTGASRGFGFHRAVSPFPDYRTISGTPTEGYSGRIQDLFVNYNVVRDAVENGSNITEILKEILKKVSDAAGGIWDFDLVGPDTSSPNNVKVQIVDRRFPGMTSAYDVQKEDQSYRFKSHTKDSIVKGLSLDVSVATEVAGMVMFAEPEPHPDDVDEDEDTDDSGDNPQTSFYARGREDRLLKQCASPQSSFQKKKIRKPKKETSWKDKLLGWTPLVDTEDEIASQEKFIVGGETGYFADYDVEFVDPNKNRMLRSMKLDDNKLNCVKNNMPLDGCELSMTLDGIEGLRLLDVFSCTGVPTHYFMNGHWRIQSVSHEVSGNDWVTDVSAEYIPSVKMK